MEKKMQNNLKAKSHGTGGTIQQQQLDNQITDVSGAI